MAIRHRWLGSGATLAIALLLTAPALLPQKSSPTKPASEGKSDNSLPHAIWHQLKQVPFYSVFDYLSFSLDGDKVTLNGQVQRPTLKADAEAAIKSLEGVGTVVNKIEVIPASAADHEIARNVYRAIFENAILQKYAVEPLPSIHIVVKNGAVNLEGSTDSEADKTLAGTLAGKVPNVASLQNNLGVRKREASPK